MKLSIVQLSDIHPKSEAQKNPILKKMDKVGRAVLGLQPDVGGCVVVVSGDTAYSGKESEYLHAKTLFDSILTTLASGLSCRPLILCAGTWQPRLQL